jgi:hypothetical protein
VTGFDISCVQLSGSSTMVASITTRGKAPCFENQNIAMYRAVHRNTARHPSSSSSRYNPLCMELSCGGISL